MIFGCAMYFGFGCFVSFVLIDLRLFLELALWFGMFDLVVCLGLCVSVVVS